MKEIPLTNGGVALVDDADHDTLAVYRWNRHTQGYATRTCATRRRTIYMHREITGAQRGEEVDHINRNGLDNQRANLRLVTRSVNQGNRGKNRLQGTAGKWLREQRAAQTSQRVGHDAIA